MTTVIVQHDVADYDVWRPMFDEHGAVRDAHGCLAATVYRGAENPNSVTVVTDWPTLADAQAFTADPSLKDAMGRGGVTGPPQISFLEQA